MVVHYIESSFFRSIFLLVYLISFLLVGFLKNHFSYSYLLFVLIKMMFFLVFEFSINLSFLFQFFKHIREISLLYMLYLVLVLFFHLSLTIFFRSSFKLNFIIFIISYFMINLMLSFIDYLVTFLKDHLEYPVINYIFKAASKCWYYFISMTIYLKIAIILLLYQNLVFLKENNFNQKHNLGHFNQILILKFAL